MQDIEDKETSKDEVHATRRQKIPQEAWMGLSCESCVLSGRGLS